MKRIRTYLLTGILILLPVVISISIFQWLFLYIDNFIIARLIYRVMGLPVIPGLGLIITVGLIIMVGALGSNFLGKRVIGLGDFILHRIPLFGMVYRGLKQIVSAIAIQDKKAFQRPVLVEYPRKDIWSVGFVTGETEGEIQHKTDLQVINVFIPTTPNPTSGFLLMVPRRDTIPLEMSVEDAVKMIISAGIITPPYPPQQVQPRKSRRSD